MIRNPFEVTKAVDFTDQEIGSRFVSFSRENYPLVDPRSAISQYLVGGKGGGRTHLMRYYSYALQRDRAAGAVLPALQAEGYIGIYAPASGLDGSRFEGAGIASDAWRAVFAQSLELRLVMLMLEVLEDLQATEKPWTDDLLHGYSGSIQHLVAGISVESTGAPLTALRTALANLQRALDKAVNNAPLTRTLDASIRFNPGSLIFEAGRQASLLPGLENVKLTYMLDELENFTVSQQEFVNTLVREKQLPTAFLIGAREWGIRTHRTLSAGEENREGSEFRKVVPEAAYGQSEESYRAFCAGMVTKRLVEGGVSSPDAAGWLSKLDPTHPSGLMDEQLLDAIGDSERQHLSRLWRAVAAATRDQTLAEQAVEAARFEAHPLLEKLAILRGYQSWSKSGVFSVRLFDEARAYITPLAEGAADRRLKNYLNLWKHDMAAQIYADHSREQPYWGFNTIIQMSGHLPRSLLVILKYITSRAEWRGEDPFSGSGTIPISTQSAGVHEASAWYLNDVRPLGVAGENCDRAIRRLGSLFRDVRYSDKPSVVNVTTFTSNLEQVDAPTMEVLLDCVRHRMLIEVPRGRQARNQGSVHRKFQLHPMLSPFFSLSMGRRGDLSLSGAQVAAVFSPTSDEAAFGAAARRLTATMRAPFSPPTTDQLF